MTRDQIIDLLTAAAAYDNRRPDQTSIHAWAESARRGHWTFEQALDAIHEHYATSTDRIMPAHITRHVQTARRAAIEAEHTANILDNGPTINLDPQLGLPIAGADGEPVWDAYDGIDEIVCPTCNAQPAEACVNLATNMTRKIPCIARTREATRTTRTGDPHTTP